ncbi:methylated-DNA--[protein]-cysteine S-methyltransferase [Telmatospirillum sp. J64-1]|uniref:methylated-DNA--[protein]-cysteine S-methyltransferase n=1 Tax=Telmatospirillum sp. J64-1 TaxID=2502183 RepID=UPI00115C70B0|nr:methylated-DNA--[protein]-cysteine S-methyltransferase [Telmatospirillum sp. J64-1]
MTWLSMHSPMGQITIAEEDGFLVSLDWGAAPPGGEETPLLARAREQLDEYFDGKRQDFDLPLRPHGTAFQKRVWEALTAIPYGRTRSYGELATELGSSPRAIGGACGRNPLPIIIPCHRVLGMGGALGGYSAMDGVEAKRYLLGLEGCELPLSLKKKTA